MRSRPMLFLSLFLFGGEMFAQEKFGKFSIGSLEELKGTVVREKDPAKLIIISEVPELEFDSNIGILDVQHPKPFEWHLSLRPVPQILTIGAAGYLSEKLERFNFRPKTAYRLKVTQVRPIPGTLSIRTKPDSATLRLNGVLLAQKTPFRNESALPDTYFVEITKERFLPVEKTLIVKSNEVTEWEVELKLGVVRVRIDIANKDLKDVGIVVDGSARGLTSRAIDLAPGRHRLLLQKVGYRYAEKIIEIPEGQQEMRLTEKLEKIKTPLYRKWWFLTGSALALGGGTAFALLGSEKPPAAKPLPEAPDFP